MARIQLTTEEMAAYLEASLEGANGDAAFIAKALGDIARQRDVSSGPRCPASLAKASTRHFQVNEFRDLIRLKIISALGLKLHAEAR